MTLSQEAGVSSGGIKNPAVSGVGGSDFDVLSYAPALWLDAADPGSVVLSGSNVAKWLDKSGNGNHAVQDTAGSQPLFDIDGLNGMPTLQFQADRLVAPYDTSMAMPDGATVFVVFNPKDITGTGAMEVISRWATGKTDFIVQANSSAQLITAAGQFVASTTHPTALVEDTPIVVSQRQEGGAPHRTSINNATENASAANVTIRDGDADFAIGNAFNSGLVNTISEVIYCPRYLTAAEVSPINNYLVTKWGL